MLWALACGLGAVSQAEFGIYALYTPNRYLTAKTLVVINFLVSRFGDSACRRPSPCEKSFSEC
jgi:hypothetical protein